jgi:hypothetical protein
MRALVLLLLSALPCLAQTFPSPGPGTVNSHGASCVSGIPNWTHTQATVSNTFNGNTISLTVTLANNPGTGHTVILGVLDAGSASSNTTTTFTAKDGNNNAYTVTPNSPSHALVANAGEAGIAYLLSAPSNANQTITVTWAVTIGNPTLYIDEFTDSNNCSRAFDTDAVGSSSSGLSSITIPSITPAQANELFYSLGTPQLTISSVNSPWVGTISAHQDGSGYVLNRSTVLAVNMTMSGASDFDSIEAAIK